MQTLITNELAQPLARQLERLTPGARVAIDTETRGLHPYEGDAILGFSLAFELDGEIESYYVPVGHDEGNVAKRKRSLNGATSLDYILRALMDRSPHLVLHHGIFDFAFLQQLGDDTTGRRYFALPDQWTDTQVVAWLHDENQLKGLKAQAAYWWGDSETEERVALKERGKERAKEVGERFLVGSMWNRLTAEDIAAYAAKDAEQTLRLDRLQREDPRVVNMVAPSQAAIDREMKLQGVVYRMIQTGIRIDTAEIERQRAEAEESVAEIEQHFHDFYDINVNSTKQLGELLFDELDLPVLHKTKGGQPQVARTALEELAGHHDLVPEILKQRRLRKALSGYLIPLSERVGLDGRIHPAFSSVGTVTGRFSCSDPNLQTIPRGDTLTGVRDVFIPEDGAELWEYDLAQAELRVIGGWAQEERLIAAIEDGRDMHSENAEALWGADFTPLQRRTAKNVLYGFAYGIGPQKLAQYMVEGEPMRKCKRWTTKKWPRPRGCGTCHICQSAQVLDGFRRLYPKVTRLMDFLTAEAKHTGYLPLHVEGRYRRFSSEALPKFRWPKPYTALNACVQGGIGEAMKTWMMEIEPHLGCHARMCLQVHDSLVMEVEPGWGPKIGEILQTIADDINPFKMRMIWDAKPWSEHD